MGNTENKTALNNTRVKDNGAKLIFDDPVLCSQFLRGYVGIDILKEVQPDDIEDISDRFLPMWQEGRDSDSVKRVSLKEGEQVRIAQVADGHENLVLSRSKGIRYREKEEDQP